MHQLYPDNGLVQMLKLVATPNVIIRLFNNNITPTLTSVLGDFAEPAWTGYAGITVPVADFTLTGVVAHVGGIQGLPVAFTPTSGAGDTIYGYFVMDSTDNFLLAVARFDTPLVSVNGVPILVTPILGDFSALSS